MIRAKRYRYYYSISMLFFVLVFYTSYASDHYNSDKILACIDFEPTIIICGRSLVSETRVRKAVGTWEKLGYSFADVLYKDDDDECIESEEYGVIVITKPNEDFDHKYLATTKRFAIKLDEQDYIIHSKIYISSKETKKERVLEHEIGHAIGWDHFNTKYHLMHENWNEGGHTISGINKDYYDKKCSK
jgi:hypothetical protein